MSRFYKKFPKPIPAFSFFSLFLLFAFSGQAFAGDPLFTVRDVKVDVTADNAVDARAQAFEQAQTQAFETLAARLLSDDQASAPPTPDSAVISSFVQDFEITDEQISPVRYVGTYTFRFKDDAVRTYLSGQGLSYTDVSSKPVLILPFYQWGTRTVLWGDNNPWRQAWGSRRMGQGLVPVVAPIGDLEDIAAIGNDSMLTYDPLALHDMTVRYGAGEAIIALAAPGRQDAETAAPDELNVMIYRTDRGKPEFASTVRVTPEPERGIYDVAVDKVRTALQRDWKNRTTVSAVQRNSLKVRVRFASMQEWIDTQKALEGIQGADNVKLLSLKPHEATVELAFRGSERRLRLALAQADMTLTTPQVSFTDPTYGGQVAAAPLVYDLYLNKYRRQ